MNTESKPPREDQIDIDFKRAIRPHNGKQAVMIGSALVLAIAAILLAVARSLSGPPDLGQFPENVEVPTPAWTVVKDDHPRSPLYRAAMQIVAVHMTDEDGSRQLGTGFLLADGVVVSAAHVVTDIADHEERAAEILCDDVIQEGIIMAIDPVRDVMVIAAPDCEAERLPLRRDVPDTDVPLHFFGFSFMPLTNEPAVYHQCASVIPDVTLKPRVHNPDRTLAAQLLIRERRMDIAPFIAVAGSIKHGNSGSPLLNPDGEVVGMGVISSPPMNRSFAVAGATIQDVLDQAGLGAE